MQTPAELVDKYRFYLKKYSTMIDELINNEAELTKFIYANDNDLDPLLLALRQLMDDIIFLVEK